MRSRSISILLAVILIAPVLGCITKASDRAHNWKPGDLVISPKASLVAPKELTGEQVQRDISYLEYAMTHGYGGRKFIRDGNLEKAMTALHKIEAPSATESFKNAIDRALLMIPDNHLVARLGGSPSPDRIKINKGSNVGPNGISNSEKVWEVTLRQLGDSKKYLYVAITKFPSHKDPVWGGFIKKVKASLPKSMFLVVDLRGNGGGDDTRGLDLAELLNGGPIKYPVTKQFVSQTPETLAIFGNNFRLRSLQLTQNGGQPPSYYAELLRESDEKYTRALAGQLPNEFVRPLKGKGTGFISAKGYKQPIYILMDGKCGSSCEITIDGFEWHPYVKKVGEPTAGCLHFGNIGYVVLPESKVQVQIPTHYNEYFDNRFIERTGIVPDIAVPTNADALAYLLGTVGKEVKGGAGE